MNRSVAHVLTTEKTYFGYTTCEILGVLLMVVPFLIGLKFEKVDYWFEVFGHRFNERKTTIKPDYISITLFVFFAAASLFLQIKDWNNLRVFLGEFKGTMQPYSNQVRDSIGTASYDAVKKTLQLRLL